MSFLLSILKKILGASPPRTRTAQQSLPPAQPSLIIETELVDQQPKKDTKHQSDSDDSYDGLLKKATALKRQGDIDGALLQIDKAISLASVGGRERPQAQKKLIYYLLLSKRKEEALKIADQIIAEAPDEAQNHRALIGTCYSFGYQQRARVLFSKKMFVDSFLDHVRAIWHWQDAMSVQGRTLDEHTPEKAAKILHQDAMRCKILVHDLDVFMRVATEGLNDSNPESMVDRLRSLVKK